jgi:hypothetical protein
MARKMVFFHKSNKRRSTSHMEPLPGGDIDPRAPDPYMTTDQGNHGDANNQVEEEGEEDGDDEDEDEDEKNDDRGDRSGLRYGGRIRKQAKVERNPKKTPPGVKSPVTVTVVAIGASEKGGQLTLMKKTSFHPFVVSVDIPEESFTL